MGRRPFVREQILNAAFDLIAKRGYEAVSTREIALAAEVGPASMFKHFPTKEDLGRALYALALAPIQAGFRELSGRPADVAAAALAFLYRCYDERPRALALLVFPPHDFTPWEVDPLIDRYLRRREGEMAPLAAAHAARIRALIP